MYKTRRKADLGRDARTILLILVGGLCLIAAATYLWGCGPIPAGGDYPPYPGGEEPRPGPAVPYEPLEDPGAQLIGELLKLGGTAGAAIWAAYLLIMKARNRARRARGEPVDRTDPQVVTQDQLMGLPDRPFKPLDKEIS